MLTVPQSAEATKDTMDNYPLTVSQIVSWFRSKQRLLDGSAVSLVHITERDEGPKPAAGADFDGPNALGRIEGWVSGEFDFHALKPSDGKDILWRHADVSAVEELEDAYADFIRILESRKEAE